MSIEDLGKPTIREIDKHLAATEKERDYFKASYSRKLEEHAETLRLAREAQERHEATCARLERERDAALLKLAEAERGLRCCAADRDIAEKQLGEIKRNLDAFLGEPRTISDSVEVLFYELRDARAKLAEAQAHAALLRAALEIVRGYLPHREDSAEVCFDWCPLCRAEAALATTPADALEKVREQVRAEILPVVQEAAAGLDPEAVALVNEGGALIREKVGRERAALELDALADNPLMGSSAKNFARLRAAELRGGK